MKKPTKLIMNALIADLRAMPAKRPLTYGESLQFARFQAARVRRWADATEPAINLVWLLNQRAVPVNLVPSYKLSEESGLTTDQVTGRLEMFINENEPAVRQRFTLAHEFKHVLDFDDAPLLHAALASGNDEIKKNLIEAIANEFAGHLLMPKPLVTSAWFKCQNVSLLANLFDVSVEAMTRRLTKLGILGTPQRRPHTYFRQSGSLLFPVELEMDTNLSVA